MRIDGIIEAIHKHANKGCILSEEEIKEYTDIVKNWCDNATFIEGRVGFATNTKTILLPEIKIKNPFEHFKIIEI